jgi:4-hydroxybenzoate polyprenyltransferase
MQIFRQYYYLMRCHQPVGSFLLLWPTLWALLLVSHGHPPFVITVIFVAGSLVMRAAGCVINDIVDRDFDGLVTRTKHRPLAAKQLSLTAALVLLFILCLIALFLVLQLNKLTFYYAVYALAMAIIYPFLKRLTNLPQLGLGIAFAWSIPMVFAAVNNEVSSAAWHLFWTVTLWPLAYDTCYAMADKTDDQKVGIKSTAILFDKAAPLLVMLLETLFLCLMLWQGGVFCLRQPYYVMLIFVFICFVYQQHLLNQHTTTAYLTAFRNNNLVGALIFIGIGLSYL